MTTKTFNQSVMDPELKKLITSFQGVNLPPKNTAMGGLIILDGPRGVGKSSTCKKIVELLNKLGRPAIYYKKGRPAYDEFVNMQQHLAIFHYLNVIYGVTIVCDRFVASELVMADYTDRENTRNLYEYCQHIAKMITNIYADNSNLVYHRILLASIGILQNRLQKRNKRLIAQGKPTRSWDMEPSKVWPMWKNASNTLNIPVQLNGMPYHQDLIISEVIAQLEEAQND